MFNTMFFSFVNMSAVWIVLMVAFLVVEATVPGLVSIWFALGALAALLSAILDAPVWLQILWFFVVSLISLILTRPFAKKYVNSRVTPTNADMVLGMECLVTEDIDNLLGQGAVSVGGKVWSARTEEADVKIPAGNTVTAIRIEGVKLIVK